MSAKEPRGLWCFLLREDHPIPYYISNVPLDSNIYELRDMIKQRIKDLRDTDIKHLKLWKPNETVLIHPDYTLAVRLADLGDITNWSKELSSEEEVGELFPERHPRKELHLVVQILPSSASLKRVCPPTDQVGRAAKRTEFEELFKQPILWYSQTCCAAIHKAIKAMPDNLDLSNPSTFTSLPFPSLLPVPSRFVNKIINGVSHFEYMGRSQFRELQQRIKKVEFLSASESLYVHGTSGSGKSHLLAALVVWLFRQRIRVIYIPDCSALIQSPEKTIWTALNFAFCDSNVLGTIRDPCNVDELIRFTVKHRQDLCIIVDQVNALEITGADDSCKKQKKKALSWLLRWKFNCRYIFSASPNEISNREADRKQSATSIFRIFGGMNKDETREWFTRYGHRIPQLTDEQRQLVEYLTGCSPLLLRGLLNIKNFDEVEFRNTPCLRDVNNDVEVFFRQNMNSLTPLMKESYLEIMGQCVRGDAVESDPRELYDLRYFYVDENGIGRSTCGIAFEAMTLLLRAHTPFMDWVWYKAVSESYNPIIEGFFVKQICLSNIAHNGLKIVDKKLGRMSTTYFRTRPIFTDFLSDNHHHTCLYVPTDYNFRAMDGIILSLDRDVKQASIFTIQFTLPHSHEQSDQAFHMALWQKWVEELNAVGFSVKSTFVWIDKMQPSEHVKPEVVKALQSHNQVIHPEYSVVHMSVETVDRKLASLLGITRPTSS